MVPKVIHYCWFGHNQYPEIVKECMKSWREMCPDYEIKFWNEDNFDYTECDYAREAYESKKWAFVSDYARLKILEEYGGIYIDTDVELLKPLDDLLVNRAFMGFEHGFGVNSGLIAGSEKNMPILQELIDIYKQTRFIEKDGTLNLKSCVEYTTELLMEKGLKKEDCFQLVDGIAIYPIEYFCPKNQYTEKITITSNTYSLHRYIGTWADETTKYGQELKKQCLELYGVGIGKCVYTLKYSFYVLKKDGLSALVKKIIRKILILVKYG